MNSYEEKQEARRERYLARAGASSAESENLYNRAHDMASVIPLGQPIHVGHHSEQKDRNYRAKIGNTFDRAHAASEKAAYYADKAESVGKGGISSDDPDAVQKLEEKLLRWQQRQERMKATNKAIRMKDIKKGNAELAKQGYTPEQIEEVRTPDYCGRIGFPSYALQNNNAEINRLKKRIESLQKVSALEPVSIEKDGYTYREEDNRCQFIFEGKPEAEIRDILKGWSFKWSPIRGAWVRQLTGNGKYAAKQVMQKLDTKK